MNLNSSTVTSWLTAAGDTYIRQFVKKLKKVADVKLKRVAEAMELVDLPFFQRTYVDRLHFGLSSFIIYFVFNSLTAGPSVQVSEPASTGAWLLNLHSLFVQRQLASYPQRFAGIADVWRENTEIFRFK